MNDIIQAIADTLYGLYPDYEIYTQDTVQDLKEPCFIIKRLQGIQRERLGDQVTLDEVYSVSFLFSQNISKLREITANVELNLRFLTPDEGRMLMTTNRQSVIVDDSSSVITFDVRSHYTSPPRDLIRMEVLKQNMEVVK